MNQKSILIAGQLAIMLGFIGFLINYFYLSNNPVLAFFIAVFFGLSLAMNLTYIRKKV